MASGSSGNCALISSGDTSLLIDAGISMKRTVKALREFEICPQALSGILITHSHTDHVSGLGMLSKYFGIPVYAPRTVAGVLRWAASGAEAYLREIEPETPFDVGEIKVTAFATPHDSPGSVGYRLSADAELGFCTDLGYITDEVADALLGADAVVLEANHDVEMLRCGAYPPYLKRRILSNTGHLSNGDCARFAAALAKSGTEYIILGHLSRENNSPEIAMSAVLDALRASGYGETKLFVAPPLGTLSVQLKRDAAKCLE